LKGIAVKDFPLLFWIFFGLAVGSLIGINMQLHRAAEALENIQHANPR
jgi:hypothetical protein